MTVIVGVLCQDGVVVGSDSVATSASGAMPIMQVRSNDKIQIFDSSIIVAATGSVGYTQRLHVHVSEAVTGKVFKNFDKRRCAGNISDRFLRDLQSTSAQNHPHHGVGFGAVIATVIKDETVLIEYATNTFQPEFKEGKLFYVSMGSGQPLADPFLAFVSRVLWKDTLPTLQMGKLGIYWALRHTLSLAPGTVGPPIRLATLQKKDTGWLAEMADELQMQEAEQYINNLESRIGDETTSAVEEAKGSPLPEVPKDE